MKPEDEFYDENTGIQYYAIDIIAKDACAGCCAEEDIYLCCELPPCSREDRKTELSVIWAEAKYTIE